MISILYSGSYHIKVLLALVLSVGASGNHHDVVDTSIAYNPNLEPYKPALPKPKGRIQEESRLLMYLMQRYDKDVRPIANVSEAVQVQVGITLTQIFDMDEKNQVMTTNVWLDQEWNDVNLVWDPEEFGGVTKLRIPCDKIWLPDVVLYNNADDYSDEYMRSLALVKHTGEVFWPPPTKFRSSCHVDVAFFPFDDQICRLKLGSWLHDGFSVNVTNRTADVDLTNYTPNGEWQLLATSIIRTERYYPCCKEPFPEITITLRIRRKTLYYMYNIVFPCMMMSTLTVLVFCLPPDSGEKIALGITVLLAFSVFMLAIAEKMPETSESIPLIGIYLVSVMAITCISVIMTVTVLNFFYRGPTLTNVPLWIQRHILKKEKFTIGKVTNNREESVGFRRRMSTHMSFHGHHGQHPHDHDRISQLAEQYSMDILWRQIRSRQGGDAQLRSPRGSTRSRINHSTRGTEGVVGNGGVGLGTSGQNSTFHFPNLPHIDDGDDLGTYSHVDSRRSSKCGDSVSVSGVKGPSGVDIRIIPPSVTESEATVSPPADRDSPVAASPTPSICLNPNPRNVCTGSRPSLHVNEEMNQVNEQDLHKIITLMAEKQKEDEQVNEILRDWKTLAQKLDYFLFWVFLAITSLTSLLFIFVLPYYNRGKLL